MISSSTNKSLIALKPALPVRGGELATGLVHAIGPTTLAITWSQGRFQVGQVVISLPNQRSYQLRVKSSGDQLYEIQDQESSELLKDLLHVVRKNQHISLCANEDVESSDRRHGFADVVLPTVALPEMSWRDIDPRRKFMGQSFAAPILITGMTGGVEQGAMINERLALAAVNHNIPMGVGSQRMALENPDHAAIFTLKKRFPSLFLIGNLGIGQLQSKDYLGDCRRAVDMIDANALAIHVNVLQELIQVEGDRDFRGLLDRIGHVATNLGVPVLVKEVGAGFDARSAKALAERGVRHLDVGGRGGTSWARIEGLRSDQEHVRRLGGTFRDWGLTTADALRGIRNEHIPLELVATGGMRDGVTALKALSLGATMVGVGLPLFRAALQSDVGPTQELDTILTELKIAMMCAGVATLSQFN